MTETTLRYTKGNFYDVSKAAIPLEYYLGWWDDNFGIYDETGSLLTEYDGIAFSGTVAGGSTTSAGLVVSHAYNEDAYVSAPSVALWDRTLITSDSSALGVAELSTGTTYELSLGNGRYSTWPVFVDGWFWWIRYATGSTAIDAELKKVRADLSTDLQVVSTLTPGTAFSSSTTLLTSTGIYLQEGGVFGTTYAFFPFDGTSPTASAATRISIVCDGQITAWALSGTTPYNWATSTLIDGSTPMNQTNAYSGKSGYLSATLACVTARPSNGNLIVYEVKASSTDPAVVYDHAAPSIPGTAPATITAAPLNSAIADTRPILVMAYDGV